MNAYNPASEFDFDAPAAVATKAVNTSRQAAASLSQEYLGHLHRTIFEMIQEADNGLTMDEICLALDGDLNRKNSISARLNWLMNNGFIARPGATRPGMSGVAQRVWVVA